MIKVEYTKPHTITKPLASYPRSYTGLRKEVIDKVLVTDAKLVLVERPINDASVGDIGFNGKHYRPILISETEKIEVGDWYYAPIGVIGNQIHQYLGNKNDITDIAVYKILALPEHFSSQQLQMIVDGKLKDGDKVLLEVEWYGHPTSGLYNVYPNPHITIYPVEECKILDAVLAWNKSRPSPFRYSEDDVKLWFEQNVE